MTTYNESRIIAVDRSYIFSLVADVERYPDFIPMWISARVVAAWEGYYDTDQEIGLGPIRERFRTRTFLRDPELIDITSADPLFETFRIRWGFAPHPRGTRVDIALTWKVKRALLQKAIDAVLPVTARRMVRTFEERARIRHSRPLATTRNASQPFMAR